MVKRVGIIGHISGRGYVLAATAAAILAQQSTVDPRDPDPSREGIFRDHNCSRCQSGAKPCVNGNPNRCEYPHARND